MSSLATQSGDRPRALSESQQQLLARRVSEDPDYFKQLFIDDGMAAVAWAFNQPELSAPFTHALWQALLDDGAQRDVLLRYLWRIPLKLKRKFVRALDQHLSDRYPMFDGLSKDWPGSNNIAPYIRPADQRSQDFDLVNQGYLGYMGLGYSLREVEMLVWLEVLRDKQCDDSPCEVGLISMDGGENKGGCPVKIHIPRVLHLMGEGKFAEAFELIRDANPLPNVTGRVCPQELQCQGVCTHHNRPIEIGQLEWFLPQRERELDPQALTRAPIDHANPWAVANKPPIAVVGSGPSGLINAYLLAKAGYPVTVFEAFHALGGVLRYGIPEFRLPNHLIDDVVAKIRSLGGLFVTNYIVGKTATLADIKRAGFAKVFVGTGAGLPRFMQVPGEHLLNIMSANEFLTRVNLMQAHRSDYETPLPDTRGKQVMVIGGGNTAMDAARTARRLGGEVTIVYRRTRAQMPARVEELHHALEEGIELMELRSPTEFVGDSHHRVTGAVLDVMELGEADSSGRRRPVASGAVEQLKVDLVIMALGNASNPIVKDAEPEIKTSKWGTLLLDKGSQQTSMADVYSGGDATRGGSTAIKAAGDGQAAAKEIMALTSHYSEAEVRHLVAQAKQYSELGQQPFRVVRREQLAHGIVEFSIHAPLIARAARAGQFVRVLLNDKGELIPLTLADWDAHAGTIDLVIQGLGSSSILMNQLQQGDHFAAIAGPLGRPSAVAEQGNKRVVFTAGGVGLPAVFPIMRAHLELGNQVTLISGFRSREHSFWAGEGQRVGELERRYPEQLEVIYTSNDGSFGEAGFVTAPLERMLKAGKGAIAEVITIGPPLMMRAVSDLTARYQTPCVASLNSIMVDATGMCGACMVPVMEQGKLVRRHACIDGPEIDAHRIDWDKFLPRFAQFKAQEQQSLDDQGLTL